VRDQRALEDRDDVLVYTSAALLEPLTMLGPVRLELFVQSSAPTTDFVAALVDVHPDGSAENVADGIVRLPVDAAGQHRQMTVPLWDVAYTFPAGHRVRVHVTSSCFPRFDRNRNLDPATSPGETCIVAVQHVHHGADHPSALVFRQG
jgi:putative CocE/NonD family hydrolase